LMLDTSLPCYGCFHDRIDRIMSWLELEYFFPLFKVIIQKEMLPWFYLTRNGENNILLIVVLSRASIFIGLRFQDEMGFVIDGCIYFCILEFLTTIPCLIYKNENDRFIHAI
jgi:hypothetical protein